MSRSGSYDVIALGDDLSALLVATLCARRGMRTLLLTQEDRPNRYTVGTIKLPVDPVPLPLRRPPFERVMRDLGIDLALRRKNRETRVNAQVCGADLRLDLMNDSEGMRAALTDEFGAAAERVEDLFAAAATASTAIDELFAADPAFPATGFWDRKAQSKQVERIRSSALAVAQLWENLQLPNRGGAAFAAAVAADTRDPKPSAAAIARALAGWCHGVGALRGDGDPVYSMVLERFVTAGGEVRAQRATELALSWGKVTAVKTNTDEELGVSQVVSSLPLARLAELLGPKAPSRLVELAAGTRIVGMRYTLNLVVAEAGIPEGMAPVVFAASSAGWPYVIHVAERDERGRVVVSATSVIAVDDARDDAKLAELMSSRRTQLLHEIGLLMPFFEKHLILLHSPHDTVPPVTPGTDPSGAETLKGMPVAMRAVVRSEVTSQESAGLASTPLVCGVKNLTLTGDQVFPQLGVEGDVLAAWNACKQVCMAAGRKKDFLRDEVVG